MQIDPTIVSWEKVVTTSEELEFWKERVAALDALSRQNDMFEYEKLREELRRLRSIIYDHWHYFTNSVPYNEKMGAESREQFEAIHRYWVATGHSIKELVDWRLSQYD